MSLKNNKRSSNRTDLTIVGHIRRVQTVGGAKTERPGHLWVSGERSL